MRTGSRPVTDRMVPRARLGWRRLRLPYWRRRTWWVLGAVVVTAALVPLGAIHLHGSPTPTLPPGPPSAPTVRLSLGQPFSVLTRLPYVEGLSGTVSITPTAVAPGAPTTTVTVRVCAGSEPVSPASLLVPGLSVQAGSALPVTAGAYDEATSATLSVVLQPGRCATGTQGFDVPGGAPVTQVGFDLGQPQSAAWTV